ncbi:MAG: ferredoxin--NADP reductase, partial [Pirellulaceae bacterium]
MALTWCPGIITERKVWADGLFTIRVRAEGVNEFVPGQFLQIGYQNGADHIHRPYSVASPWGEEIEFFIVRVDDGELTPWLWERQAGDDLDVSQRAAGSFTLKKTPRTEVLWLIATGTGLAPYIAMLRTAEPWQEYQKIVVIHGARMAPDLAYSDELLEMIQQHPDQLAYIPTLTRDDAEGVLRGRIPALVRDGSLESAAGCEMKADNSAVMLCGNPAMLD